MAKIVIIGAGLTGISAAYHLEQKGFYDYKIFEKENKIGGLCGTVYQDGYTFDFTGHLLHVSDKYFENMIHALVGIENMNRITRRSYIYSHDTYTKYPFQINMYGLPTQVIIDCITEFVNKEENLRPKNFYEWAVSNFGSGISKHFFVPFQTKIFDYDITKITASWTGRFVPKTSLKEMLFGSLEDHQDNTIGYNSNFLYPKQDGIIFWVKKIAAKLHNKIETDHELENVDLQNKILIFKNGHIETFDELITTMPLDNLLRITTEPTKLNLKKYADNLICNSVINFNLGVKNRNISNKHWIYFPEDKFPFYRIGFPHNFSDAATPHGCSSLYGEMSYTKRDQKYVKEKLDASLHEIKRLLKISDSEIATEKIINISHAYVLYDFFREKNLNKILSTLKEYDIHSIGRYGEWKYSSMQEAVLDGKKVVEELLVSPARKEFVQAGVMKERVKRKSI